MRALSTAIASGILGLLAMGATALKAEGFYTNRNQIRQAQTANMIKQSGRTRAEVSYKKSEYVVENVRIKIVRDDKILINEIVSSKELERRLRLSVEDLDGDSEPEVILTHNPGLGERCCTVSRIYGYQSNQARYVMTEGDWRGAGTPRIVDLDNDGKYEFEYDDWRFAYQFTSFGDSVFPIRIWRYRQGRLDEVTSQYPKNINISLKKHGEWHRRLISEGRELKGSFAAYVAEKSLLGKGEQALQEIRDSYRGADREEFLIKLRRFLRKTGYMSVVDSSSKSIIQNIA
jgi:hypothetical protein